MPQKKISELNQKTVINNSDLFLLEDSNLINNSIKFEDIYNKIELSILNKLYPIGSLYTSTIATSPMNALGFGEWEQIKDTFLLACGDTYENGSTGGEVEHTLTIEEMPKISGYITMHSAATATNIHNVSGCFTSSLTNSNTYTNGGTQYSGAHSIGTITFDNGGEEESHNNMPPYLAIYVWKRIK